MSIYKHTNTITRKIKFMREAASVRRCHTVPIIGEYNVGYHSFNMLAMLRILWPKAPLHLIWAIVEHDAPERLTGDIPAPTKWFGIVNKPELQLFERQILIEIYGEDSSDKLTDEELSWLAGLDIFELALFCRDQLMFGNRNLEVMLERIHTFVRKNAHLFAPKVLDVYWESFSDDWSMMPDLGDL